MSKITFLDKLSNNWNLAKFVCVGLDKGEYGFDKKIIDATSDLVCAYKLNSAFYEAQGSTGWKELENTINYLKDKCPEVVVILDSKRADVENTNQAYAKAIFDNLGADATTVNPYLGGEALKIFIDRLDKGIIVLVKTSNPGAGEFQDLPIDGKPLFEVVAEHVRGWNTNGNLGVVVGATYPKELKMVREIIGDMPILVPGVGAQGGDLKATILAGKNSKGQGIIISSSRGIIFTPDPREATKNLNQQIQEALNL